MKRYVVFALILLAGSCKKGEEVAPAFDTTLLPGQWKLLGLTTNPAQDGPAGKGVTDLLAAYRQQIGGPCIDTTRVGFSEQGKISRTTISDCVSKTNELFGFAVNGTWQARGSSLTVAGAYATAEYYDVTLSQTTLILHRHQPAAESPDNKPHEITLTWSRR